MRRKGRQVQDIFEIYKILSLCDTARIDVQNRS